MTLFFVSTKVLLKLRTSVDAKDGADKSSIVDNLRYESTGYNSVAEHFLGFLVSPALATLVGQLSDYHRLTLEEAEAVREDPAKRGAQLRALLAQKAAERLPGAASSAPASKRKAAGERDKSEADANRQTQSAVFQVAVARGRFKTKTRS